MALPGKAGAEANTKERLQLTRVPQARPAAPLAPSSSALADFARKLKAAWRIFFPEPPPVDTPKREGMNRLRMILVADRCGMNPSSMYQLRHSIVRAVSDFVDIEAEELVEVNVSSDPDIGTIYSVAVPIRRVKPKAQLGDGGEAVVPSMEADGIALSWDPADEDSSPAERFPWGC